MSYIRLQNGQRFEEEAKSICEIMDKYHDDTKHEIIISGMLVYVVVKEE